MSELLEYRRNSQYCPPGYVFTAAPESQGRTEVRFLPEDLYSVAFLATVPGQVKKVYRYRIYLSIELKLQESRSIQFNWPTLRHGII